MKQIHIFFMLIAFLLCLGCSSDDDGDGQSLNYLLNTTYWEYDFDGTITYLDFFSEDSCSIGVYFGGNKLHNSYSYLYYPPKIYFYPKNDKLDNMAGDVSETTINVMYHNKDNYIYFFEKKSKEQF